MSVPLSTYLSFLPPVLWENEAPPPAFSLGRFLCIFEKILTGLNDDVPQGKHPAIQDVISRLPLLFDPWRTPPEFLPYIASWVGLALPDDWDEYRRRRAIGQIVSIYHQRGSITGLARLLDLYTAGPLRPRIAIDDGSKLLAARLRPANPSVPFALQSQGPLVRSGSPFLEGLVRPQCIAIAPDGYLFVGDDGYSFSGTTVPARLWRLSPRGEYPMVRGKPQPLRQIRNPDGSISGNWSFNGAIGVAIRKMPGWQAWFLDGDHFLYLVTSTSGFPAQKFAPAPPAAAWPPTFPGVNFTPIAIACHPSTNDLIFLDRGADRTSPAKPGIVVLGNLELLPEIHRVPLSSVVEPLSLAVLPNGDLLIGDGGKQQQANPPVPADLTGNLVRVQIDRSNPANWVAAETVLLDPASSPLVAPTALASIAGDVLLVLDSGLKPARPSTIDPFIPDVARPAVVHQVDLSGASPVVSMAVAPGRLVDPQAMAVAGDVVYLCDPGMPAVASQDNTWRVQPHRFGVVVHFPRGLLPQNAAERSLAMDRVLGTIRDLVDQERSSQSCWDFFTQSGA